jgi:hypothetical protein
VAGASRSKRREAIRIVRKRYGKHFDGDFGLQPNISGEVNFSDPAGGQRHDNFIRPQMRAAARLISAAFQMRRDRFVIRDRAKSEMDIAFYRAVVWFNYRNPAFAPGLSWVVAF